MDTQQNQVPQDMEKLKEIPKWTRRYAQNRVLTLVVLTGLMLFFSIVFSIPVAISIAAFIKGNTILGLSFAVAAIALWVALFIVIFKKFGGKNRGLLDRLIDQRMYGRDGAVSLPKQESSNKKRWAELAAAAVWFALLFVILNLGWKHVIQDKYVQPVSALFWVPYMICGWYFWHSPRMGPIYLLHPIFYAIHAILIMGGVPLFFTGFMGPPLNLSVPYIGYGLLTYVIGHFYGRYALKKLKGLAHVEGGSANGV